MNPKLISTFGSDIEFMYFDKDGVMLPARDFTGKNVGDCFGTDGADRIAEIRVKPAYSPRELFVNTFTALKTGYDKYPKIRKLQWKAIGDMYQHSVGTHYHAVFKWTPDFLLLCDQILASTMILLENVEHARSRAKLGYAKFSNYRDDQGNDRSEENKHEGFEYRTVGSVLHSKLGTYVGYILWAALTDAYYNHGIKSLKTVKLSEKAYKDCDKAYFINQLPAIWDFVDSLPYFNKCYIGAKYYRDVYNFYKHLFNGTFPDPKDRDIRIVWGLDTKENLKELTKNNTITIDELFGVINNQTNENQAQENRPRVAVRGIQ